MKSRRCGSKTSLKVPSHIKKNSGLFTSFRQDWETPPEIARFLVDLYGCVLDPCASSQNAKCDYFYDEKANGLKMPWARSNFVNPPYNDVEAWLAKAWTEYQEFGHESVLLLPARISTGWFHKYALKGHVTFVEGRIKFIHPDRGTEGENSPMGSVIVVYGRKLLPPTITVKELMEGELRARKREK